MAQDSSSPTAGSSAIQVIIYWAIVAVPLGWGVYKTVDKSKALFQAPSVTATASPSPSATPFPKASAAPVVTSMDAPSATPFSTPQPSATVGPVVVPTPPTT